MLVTEWDDYLIHQIADTIEVVERGDPHFMDRFFFGCHDAEGTLHLMAGLGTYPSVNIMDGFVCVRHKDVQRNIRISRHLQSDRANTQIGPLSFKVLEPLKRWGIYLGDNDYGIGCSLEFEGRIAPYLFPKIVGADPESGALVHYNQPGRYTGSITFEGQQFNADGFLGPRDRSWGIRRPGGFAALEIYFWLQAQFSSSYLTLTYAEMLDGAIRLAIGGILSDDGTAVPFVEASHRIEFVPGFRSYNKVEMLLKDANGKEWRVIAKPISPESYMSGCGYDDRHGLDRGPFHVEGERWEDVSQPVA
ncbi:MAG: hypothetical protein IMY87_00930, partial [Chloroflexi bacterium]|nr:hypothetical protein [Chloroflexota bacterium]